MKLRIKKVPYEVVAPWRSQAARDHVALGPTSNTVWYGAFRGDALVGVAGLITIGQTVRVKGVFVPRALRGEGIGSTLTEALLKAAPEGARLEVLAYAPEFYTARGFAVVGQPRPGVSRLVLAGR